MVLHMVAQGAHHHVQSQSCDSGIQIQIRISESAGLEPGFEIWNLVPNFGTPQKVGFRALRPGGIFPYLDCDFLEACWRGWREC